MSDDTKERILDGAERLFGAQGYSGTSLRAVTREAGVNLAAVNYHFGSKEGLLVAVLERRIAPLNAERLARLDALEAREAPPSLEELVRVFVEPPVRLFLDLGEEGRGVLRLLGRSHTESERAFCTSIPRLFEETIRRFHRAFSRALPELPPEAVTFRLMALVGVLTFFLHRRPPAMEGIPLPNLDPSHLVDDIVAFALPGMASAPH